MASLTVAGGARATKYAVPGRLLILPRLRGHTPAPIEHLDQIDDAAFEGVREAKQRADGRRGDAALEFADEHRVRVGPFRELGLGEAAGESQFAEVRAEDLAFRAG